MCARQRPLDGRGAAKLVVAAVIAAVVVLVYFKYGDALTLESLAQKEVDLREFQEAHPAIVYGLAFAAYVTITGLSVPGATGLTLVYSWYFGLVRGVVLVSFASTAGATLAFLTSRYLLRDAIRSRFGHRLQAFDSNLQRDGAFYLFTLRLIPAVPFVVINFVMGLTELRTRTFWWVSQLGMLPGTVVYVYAGSSVPDLSTLAERGAAGILSPQLVIAFILLGLFPLLAKKTLAVLGRRQPGTDTTSDTATMTARDDNHNQPAE
jgi:uncharacterized membrane protein YdjX (TVP38/TMEM64 family)